MLSLCWGLGETELLSYFRSLLWGTFLDNHLRGLPLTEHKSLTTAVLSALGTEDEGGPCENDLSSVDDPVEILRSIYTVHSAKPRGLSAIVFDVKRVWSARDEEIAGKKAVRRALSAVFIKEANHNLCKSLGSELDSLGLKSNQVLTTQGTPQRFYTSSIRKAEIVKRLLAFWAGCVSETTAKGFIGRHWGMSRLSLITAFRKQWTADLLADVDTAELKDLAQFMGKAGTPISPSTSGERIYLDKLILVDPDSDSEANDEADPKTSTSHSSGSKKRPARAERKKNAPKKIPLVSSYSSSEESEGDISSHSSDSEGYPHRVSAMKSRHKVSGLHLGFHGLSKHLPQVLVQGGRDFEDLFDPLQVEVTTVKELRSLFHYFKANQMLTSQLCRANRLDEDPSKCLSQLQESPVYIVRPEYRIQTQLSFPPATRRAPMEIRRWLTHGSIIPWVDRLQAKAGPVERDNADGYLAPEIMVLGMVLASLLDECHPRVVVYLDGVKRLVRRLLVIERALTMERKEGGAFYEKQLSFMGIGEGHCRLRQSSYKGEY